MKRSTPHLPCSNKQVLAGAVMLRKFPELVYRNFATILMSNVALAD